MHWSICGPGRRKLRNNRGSAEIAEFVPVLYVILLLMLMPLLDLVAVFVAGATQYLATNDLVAKAASQPNYTSALNSMVNEAYQFSSNGLAKFSQMVPKDGYTGCGNDLYVLVTDTTSGTVTSSAPDQPISQPINTQSSIYELSVKSVYNVGPLVSLRAVPILGDIPGLGKPVTLSFTASRPMEHPGGFESSPSGSIGTASVSPFARVANGTSATATAGKLTWRDPNIFQEIQNSGKTVVGVSVVQVPANQAYLGQLTQTGLSVLPGQTIWIDTQATGNWQTSPAIGYSDANGYPGQTFADAYVPSLTYGALLGQVSSTGTPFFLGNEKYSLPLTNSGPLYLVDNQCLSEYMNGSGYQLVRVIVTQ